MLTRSEEKKERRNNNNKKIELIKCWEEKWVKENFLNEWMKNWRNKEMKEWMKVWQREDDEKERIKGRLK